MIDKQLANKIGKEVEQALQEVAARHGLTVEIRGGSFDSGSFRPKVEFKTSDADANEFRRYAALFDLDPDDFGAEFSHKGKTYRISGIAPRSSVRPILVTEVGTDKVFAFPEASVKTLLAQSKAAV
jgi:hypothetical protein